MCNEGKWYRLTSLQGKNRDTDVENKCMDTKGIKWGAGELQDWDRHIYTNTYKIDNWGDLQDCRGVRNRDHLPAHKQIKNTSTCETAPTEHLMNAGKRPQTSQKARKSPSTWVGQKKKEKTETKG